MKQRITQQQYDSLSYQSKIKYLEWIVGQEKKQGINNGNDRLYYAANDIMYWSINNMILFIDDHIEEGWWNIEREGDKIGWRVQSKYIEFDEDDVPELIDALWSAVKVLLDEDDQISQEVEDCNVVFVSAKDDASQEEAEEELQKFLQEE